MDQIGCRAAAARLAASSIVAARLVGIVPLLVASRVVQFVVEAAVDRLPARPFLPHVSQQMVDVGQLQYQRAVRAAPGALLVAGEGARVVPLEKGGVARALDPGR